MDPIMLLLGIALVFIGLVVLLVSLFIRGEEFESSKRETKTGGVIIIGPLPIVFGSDKSVAIVAAIIGIVLTALAIVLTLILWGWKP